MLRIEMQGQIAALFAALAFVSGGFDGLAANGQEPPATAARTEPPARASTTAESSPTAEPAAAETPAAEVPAELVRLSKTHDIWLDKKRNAVVIDGEVCLRAGQLEMFACPKGTKEHESIVSLNCLPEQAHAGLLAAGAKPGTAVKFDPEYQPATGPVIDIYVLWRDEQGGKHQARAQEWIKHAKTGKAMEYDWVFAGSGFWKDEETGKEHYQANGGDFICVSNFPTATLDLPVQSSQANADLLFHAFTEKIPPKKTKVRLVLIPRKDPR
ncbi:MAG: YdjY domain-containing protein [Pirellulaceae bacterium]